MSFLRSLTVFILSLIFTSFIIIAITSYTLGDFLQKESVKGFLKTEGTKFLNQQCEEDCKQYTDYKEECIQICISEITNQTDIGVDKVVDEIYKQRFFGTTLNEASSFFSEYFLFFVVGIIAGILLFIASKTPFSTLGKDIISISILLFISSLSTQFMFAYINLPFDLGKAINDYLSPGFNQQIKYGIILLVVGIVLIAINYIINRRKKKKK